MTRIQVESDRIAVLFEAGEAGVLGSLAAQLAELMGHAEHPATAADPALRRILPEAYPDDAEASAEFRRYSQQELAGRKAAAATRLLEELGSSTVSSRPTRIDLDLADAERWLRTITDARLALASRLGILQDGDEPEDGPAAALYQWLGEVQWTLVDAVDELEAR
ncbi:DUF2017 family protein [Homoserinibacter sp. YIM 151385]|uniref:DUF2017 family protein n=1 Tax=Homoserinibacter sp. YIM 151385 TaxID=2985506 RepID=UPI0022F126F5|nr:DUF2017 family protein [Homoserinibacter sp. YIM 151385]WBU39064.1 DUF2017 family protein [Homoserinibacter sp. YIM 151385]